MAAYTDLRALRRDSYASGPFTRVQFVIRPPFKGFEISVPINYPVGQTGDLVYTINGELMRCRYY
jgi:hypothetical protein